MHYFLTNKFEYNFSGIEHAQIYRYNIFQFLGVESKIITFDYTPALDLFLKRQKVSRKVSLNMFDFWQGFSDLNFKKNVDELDNQNIVKNRFDNYKIEYYSNNWIENFYNENKNVIHKINYFDEQNSLMRTDYFDIRGFISQSIFYNNKQNIVKKVWFNLHGHIVLTEDLINNYIDVDEDNPQYNFNHKNRYTSWIDLKAAWLDFIVEKDKYANIYVDRAEYVTPIVIRMKNQHPKKFIVLHSAHTVNRQDPCNSPLNDVRQLELNYSDMWSGYIASTEQQAHDFEKRTHILTSAIPVSYTVQPKKIVLNNHNNLSKHIVYLSRISREKKIEDAIQAMAYVVKKNPNVDLKVYGYVTDSIYNDELHQLIDELSLTRNVHLMPYNPDRDYLFKNSDLFLLTSKYEGFNMSMLEASAFGIPLVAYNVKYGPENIIKTLKNGFLIDFGDINSIAEKVLKVLDDKDLYNKLQSNGLKYSQKNFSKHTVAEKWKNFFRIHNINITQKNYYVVTGVFGENNALKPVNIALKDIAVKEKFLPLIYPTENNAMQEFYNNFQSEDVALLSYPSFVLTMPTKLEYDIEIIRTLKNKGVKIILFVNDSLILRELSDFMNNELKILNMADSLLIPSKEMKIGLTELGVKTKILLPFEFYPLPDHVSKIYHSTKEKKSFSRSVMYAGNLEKAKFLTKISYPHLIVYGPNPADELVNNPAITYKGQISVEKLSREMENYSGFGLVWDGDYNVGFSKESRYTRYNVPYKATHYIRSGIPIIAWSGSSLGKYIKKKKIGITLDSLNDLNSKLSSLKDCDIVAMLKNLQKINQRIIYKNDIIIKNIKYIKNIY